jgi:Smg protein
MSLYLAIDLGTTGCRSILYNGMLEEVGNSYREYALLTPREKWAEQDANLWWALTLETAKEAIAASGLPAAEIRGISVSSQGITVVPVDANFVPLCNALSWLDGVAAVAQAKVGEQREESIRLYAPAEQEHLGEQGVSFIAFLESAGVLPPAMREMVIDRASVVPGGPLDLEDLKIIVLMVFWSLGEEPDALILDELFVAEEDRLIH